MSDLWAWLLMILLSAIGVSALHIYEIRRRNKS